MAKDVELMLLQMSADLRRLDKGVADGQKRFDKRLTDIERRALQNDKKLSAIFAGTGRNITASFQEGLRGLAPSLAAAFSVSAVIKYADSYTGLQNSLKAAGLEGARLTQVENALYDAANRNGVAVEATAQLFQRAALARNRLGASDETLTRFVSGTTAALKLQGTSAEAASGPLLQLGQAISGSTVQAEEFGSLIDGLPVLLQAAASGSSRFGGDVATLTEQVKAGKVSSKEFFDAILAGLPAIEERAGKAQTTVGAALQTLNNQLGRFVGQTDSGLSATARLAQGIELLANNLDIVVTSAGIAVAIVGTRMTVAFVAATVEGLRYQATLLTMAAAQTGVSRTALLASGSLGALRTAALFFVTNPIGIAITAVALALGVLALRGNEGSAAMRQIDADAQRANSALDEYERAANDAAAASGAAKAKALEHASALRVEAQDAVDAARANYELARSRRVAAAQAEKDAAARSFRSVDGGKGAADAATASAAAAGQRLTRAEREEAAAKSAADEATARLDRIQRGGPGPAPATIAPSRGGGGGGAGSAAQQQSRREELDLERQIAAARAVGDEAAIKALEERQRLAQLIASYESAGFADAKGKALEHLGYENEAAALAERRELAEKSIAAIASGTAEATQAFADAQERAANAALDRLSLEVELARLSGDTTLPAKQRELFIEERINDLLRERPTLSREQAQGQAEGEYDSLRAADIRGGLGITDPAGDRMAAMEEIARLREQDLLSEEEAAQRKAQIDADYWDRRSENARSGLDALAGLQNSSNKKLAAIGKAAALAQATMDGVLAVQKALASAPPPLNFVNAAIVGAAAAANVAQIAGLKDGGLVTGPGGPRDDKVLRRLSAGEFVVNAAATKQNRGLLEAINGGMGGQVSALAAGVGAAAGRGGDQSFSTTIDARGAELGVERRIRALLAERDASFNDRVRGVQARTAKYALGRRQRP